MGRRWQGSKKPLRVMNFDATGNVCTGAKLAFASECRLMESSGILRRATSLNESVANNIPPPSICTCVCARVSMCLDEGRRVWHRHRGFLWASFPWILSAADSRERVRQYARKPRDGCQDTVVPQLCRIRLYIYIYAVKLLFQVNRTARYIFKCDSFKTFITLDTKKFHAAASL